MKHFWVWVALLAYSSYSYSDPIIYGTTDNAVGNGLSWDMTNVLPQQSGLTVGSVIYSYTTEKLTEDDMIVHIQNENAKGTGYTFRESDDWSGLPSNTINKVVQVGDIDIGFWGQGSIEVEGEGSVSDPTVIYSYRYDMCHDPQSDPSCPGYVDPNMSLTVYDVEIVDPLDQDYVQDDIDRKKVILDEDEQEEKDRQKLNKGKKVDKRLEKVLGLVNSTLLAVEANNKHLELMALNMLPSSYNVQLSGGSYEDTVVMKDKKIPQNKNGLRNGLAQQVLHQKMVDSQYDK